MTYVVLLRIAEALGVGVLNLIPPQGDSGGPFVEDSVIDGVRGVSHWPAPHVMNMLSA